MNRVTVRVRVTIMTEVRMAYNVCTDIEVYMCTIYSGLGLGFWDYDLELGLWWNAAPADFT